MMPTSSSARAKGNAVRRTLAIATLFAAQALASAPAFADLLTYLLPFAKFGTVENTDCGAQKGICGAVASMNSYTYLLTQYPQFYGNTIKPIDQGSFANQTDAAKAWAVNGWTAPNGTARMGFYPRPGTAGFDFWHTKIDWLEDWAPGRTVYEAFVFTTQDVTTWARPGGLTAGYPTWDFLLREVRDGEDIELFLKQVNGAPYHVVTLTGLEIDDRDPTIRFIRYQDPNDPTREKRERLTFNATAGRWEFADQLTFGGNRVFIEAAFSESPVVPLPAAAWLMLSGFALLWSFQRGSEARRGVVRFA